MNNLETNGTIMDGRKGIIIVIYPIYSRDSNDSREREREDGFHVQNTINISTVIIPDEYLVNLHINI